MVILLARQRGLCDRRGAMPVAVLRPGGIHQSRSQAQRLLGAREQIDGSTSADAPRHVVVHEAQRGSLLQTIGEQEIASLRSG